MISRPGFGALAAAALASISLAAAAGPFTPGNVVVYRIGSGSGALSANGNPVFLDEFTPAGLLVQSVPLPTAADGANKALIASGTATSDGLLTRTLRIAIDRTPPVIAGLPAASCSIWPPNGKLVNVATISASDPTSGIATWQVTGASSEPGDGDVVITGAGTAPRAVSLRASRAATGPGRTYTINASAVDAAGNTATATATCVVPHDQR